MGDPVLAGVAGLTLGAVESGTTVTLAGGTQLAAAAALVRHAGVEAPLELATTTFVAEDESAAIRELADELALTLTVTDPSFEHCEHPAVAGYVAGEAKEGVGMGGVLAACQNSGISMARLRERIVDVYERISVDDEGTNK
jgi:NaMN:DMB phosphoribosyltransferase